MTADGIPLIVDLDGTLIDGDTLHLSLGRLVLRRPWLVPVLPFVALTGRARFKRYISDRVELPPESLRYRADVLRSFNASAPAAGRSSSRRPRTAESPMPCRRTSACSTP